jgi:hypothetical protein
VASRCDAEPEGAITAAVYRWRSSIAEGRYRRSCRQRSGGVSHDREKHLPISKRVRCVLTRSLCGSGVTSEQRCEHLNNSRLTAVRWNRGVSLTFTPRRTADAVRLERHGFHTLHTARHAPQRTYSTKFVRISTRGSSPAHSGHPGRARRFRRRSSFTISTGSDTTGISAMVHLNSSNVAANDARTDTDTRGRQRDTQRRGANTNRVGHPVDWA